MKIFAITFVLVMALLLPQRATAQTVGSKIQAATGAVAQLSTAKPRADGANNAPRTTAGSVPNSQLQLISVPEPSSWLLAGAGAGAFFLLRRRRQA